MSSLPAPTRSSPLPTFSLRQYFAAVMALAIAFSIWVAPQGNWLDIPVTVLAFYFLRSLLGRAASVRSTLRTAVDLPQPQRRAAQLFLAGLLILTLVLVIAVCLRFLAANNQLPKRPEVYILDYAASPELPCDLAVLTMVLALGFNFQARALKSLSFRRDSISVLAVVGSLILIFVYWADRMLIPVLVYIAVSGVEAANLSN